jgi:TRAP-type C4-dicarboxylate transport system substrate-binding protein
MMKTRNLVLKTLAVAIGLAAAGVSQAGPILMKFASPYPVGHPSYLMAKDYIDEIHKLSGNKVKIAYFPAQQLGKAKDMLNVCGKGVADFCQIHITYFAGQLPYSNVVVLPYWTTAAEGSAIYQKLMETSPEIEQELRKYGVKAMLGTTTPTYDVATVKKPVQKLEDLKGLKLKTAGGIFDIIAKRYGIVPVSIPAAETYEAVQRGVVDGVVFNYPSIRSYHLNDQVKYITNGMRAGGYPGTIIINEKSWAKLPADVKDVITKVNRGIAAREGAKWDALHQEVMAQFKKQGIQIYDLSPQQRMVWAKALDGVGDEYVAEMEKRGFKQIRKVYADYRKIADQIAK